MFTAACLSTGGPGLEGCLVPDGAWYRGVPGPGGFGPVRSGGVPGPRGRGISGPWRVPGSGGEVPGLWGGVPGLGDAWWRPSWTATAEGDSHPTGMHSCSSQKCPDVFSFSTIVLTMCTENLKCYTL